MDRKLFHDDEIIIGYSDDIIDELEEEIAYYKEKGDEDVMECFGSSYDLIEQLKVYDWELVKCVYHPMGSWFVCRLVEE